MSFRMTPVSRITDTEDLHRAVKLKSRWTVMRLVDEVGLSRLRGSLVERPDSLLSSSGASRPPDLPDEATDL